MMENIWDLLFGQPVDQVRGGGGARCVGAHASSPPPPLGLRVRSQKPPPDRDYCRISHCPYPPHPFPPPTNPALPLDMAAAPRTPADGPLPGVNWGGSGGPSGMSGLPGDNATDPMPSPPPHARSTLFDGASNSRYPVGCGGGLWLRG
jgi:hypothetical protein